MLVRAEYDSVLCYSRHKVWIHAVLASAKYCSVLQISENHLKRGPMQFMTLWNVDILTFSPIARMMKPEKGMTQPWVMPQALCTTTKSKKNKDDI